MNQNLQRYSHCPAANFHESGAGEGRLFLFSIFSVPSSLLGGAEKSYRLSDSVVTSTGALRQIYVYTGDKEKNEIDEVIELLWEP
jgi:hypothetical protein